MSGETRRPDGSIDLPWWKMSTMEEWRSLQVKPKPCPFCGNEQLAFSLSDGNTFIDCGCGLRLYWDGPISWDSTERRHQLIEKWNTRV